MERIALNNVSVSGNNPLILIANMTSFHHSEIEFSYGYIQDKNQTVVAQCLREVPYGSSADGRGHWSQHYVVCVVPANSTAQVSLNFNTTLPSGNYCLKLGYWSYSALYSDYFTIP